MSSKPRYKYSIWPNCVQTPKSPRSLPSQAANPIDLIQDWLLITRRSLTLSELTCLVNIMPGDESYRPDPFLTEAKVRQYCEPEAQIDPKTRVVTLSKSTTADLRHETASLLAATTCITILLFNSSSQQKLSSLHTYAAINWGEHAKRYMHAHALHRDPPGRPAKSTQLLALLRAFFANETALRCALQVMGVDNPSLAQNLTPLHLAAMYDLDQTMKTLLDGINVDVNVRDRMGRTPLAYAIQTIDHRVFRLLLTVPGIDVNAPQSDYGCDMRALLKIALRKTGIYCPVTKFPQGLTPLHVAAVFNYDQVARNVLERKLMDGGEKDGEGRTAVWYAAKCGNKEVLSVLCERGKVVEKDDGVKERIRMVLNGELQSR